MMLAEDTTPAPTDFVPPTPPANVDTSGWTEDAWASTALAQVDHASDTDGADVPAKSVDLWAPESMTETADQVFSDMLFALDLGTGFDSDASAGIPSNGMNFAALWNADAHLQAPAAAAASDGGGFTGATPANTFAGSTGSGQATAPLQLGNIVELDTAAGPLSSLPTLAVSTAGPTTTAASAPAKSSSAATTAAAPTAAPEQATPEASTASADSGPTATPLFTARVTAAPSKVAHPNAANGAAPFSPQQLQQAYGINSVSNQGAGQTIYIIDAFNDPNISRDLQTFDAQWGLPNPTLTVHKMSSRIRNSASWGLEESLDVEWAHSIAPQANITLVEATSTSFSALFAASDWATNQGGHIVSMSFGATDFSGESSYDYHFNHSGVTYLASTGDVGGVVQYPSASPYVLAVGGTSLTLDSNNNYVSESAWSGGGGGTSGNEAAPGYQTSYGLNYGGRSTPDVSFDADPNTGVYVYDTYLAGGWYEVGGTSLAAPSFAGLIALADHGRSTPLSSNSLTTRTEYTAATGSAYASNYHDITTGSNGFPAGPGYDQATGVGSPQANNLVPWLNSH
jgi:hypothetical protein